MRSKGRMKKYEEVAEARRLLELPERATMEEIQMKYRSLIKKWHPDTCDETKEKCTEMTAKIVAAYKIIMDYCKHYRFSFSKREVRQYLSEEEWWLERFGSDPVWHR
ncbi:MAG: J domain-containing protein [Deltaproteobacteria bacterium]